MRWNNTKRQINEGKERACNLVRRGRTEGSSTQLNIRVLEDSPFDYEFDLLEEEADRVWNTHDGNGVCAKKRWENCWSSFIGVQWSNFWFSTKFWINILECKKDKKLFILKFFEIYQKKISKSVSERDQKTDARGQRACVFFRSVRSNWLRILGIYQGFSKVL